ncbi:MAG: hypothetical protein JO261_12330 [Alphaproteobacteria bacterium]|nr:hypothetical protein [Alphaproteobacteria bacterium]MBV9694476.1 hypothetical protein [Alphaproteobacteria bacterium]
MAVGATAATAPAANARVVVGVGIGGPAYPGGRFCYYHPHRCYGPGYYAPAYYGPGYYAGPQIGVFYAGRGWWDGHRYWGHRYWFHGGWRFR